MTSEERFERIERQIESVVEQQAQFATGLQEERQERREREALMQRQIDAIQGHLSTLALTMVDLSVKMERLTEAQARSDEKIARLAEGMRELEERLNAFITSTDREISGLERQMMISDGKMSTLRGHIVEIAEGIKALVEMADRGMEAQMRTDAIIADLSQTMERLAGKVEKLPDGMQKLEEKSAETEERLSAFIIFVERYLSQRDNGQRPTQE